MEAFFDWLDTPFFEWGPLSLRPWKILAILAVLLAVWGLRRVVRWLIFRDSFLRQYADAEHRKALFMRWIGRGIWVLALLALLRILAIDLGTFFDYELLSFGEKGSIRIINIFQITLIIILARIAVWYARRQVEKASEGRKTPLELGKRQATIQIFKYLIYLVTVLVILSTLDIDFSLIIASSAALFVGIGLALQNTFEDIASGLFILFEGTIEVGDMVYVDSLKLEGRVTEIRMRTSIIETLDSVSVIVPNSKFTNTNVINWNFNDRETRFHIQVGVAYGSNVQLVRRVLKASAQSHGLVLKNPEPRVRFLDFGDSALIFDLLFWTNRSQEYEDIRSDIRFKIDAEFRRHGIQIPFPQRDLHLKSDYRDPSARVQPASGVGEEGEVEFSDQDFQNDPGAS